MSLVLNKYPQSLDLVHNRLFFQIQGTSKVLQEGSKASFKITMPDAPSVGQEMQLTFMSRVHNFIFTLDPDQDVPDGYDYVLPSYDKSEMFLYLANYAPLKTYYTGSYLTSYMEFEAIVEGSDYNITVDSLPTENWTSEITDGVDYEEVSNYHFLVTVYANKLSDTGTFTALPEFRIDPDDDQLSYIELGRILRPRFLNFFELPDFDLNTPTKAILPVLSYYMVLKEMSDTTILATKTTGTYKVINGKVNHSSHPDFNLRTWINSYKKFLTNMPSQVYTNYSAKHYLYYMSPYAADTSVQVYFDINSKSDSDPETYTSDSITLSQDGILVIPVTDILASISTPSKLVYVTVSVKTESGTTIAGTKTYIYLPKTEYNRSFLFQNRWGVFDTIVIQKQSNTLEVEKETNRTILQPGYSQYIGDLSSDDPEIEDTFEAETGPITLAMAQHYKELAISRVVFLQSDDRWIRVHIVKGSFSISDEDDELHNVKFTYKSAFADDMLSATLSLPEAENKDYSDEYLETDYQ
jgi:hypothetical protein